MLGQVVAEDPQHAGLPRLPQPGQEDRVSQRQPRPELGQQRLPPEEELPVGQRVRHVEQVLLAEVGLVPTRDRGSRAPLGQRGLHGLGIDGRNRVALHPHLVEQVLYVQWQHAPMQEVASPVFAEERAERDRVVHSGWRILADIHRIPGAKRDIIDHLQHATGGIKEPLSQRDQLPIQDALRSLTVPQHSNRRDGLLLMRSPIDQLSEERRSDQSSVLQGLNGCRDEHDQSGFLARERRAEFRASVEPQEEAPQTGRGEEPHEQLHQSSPWGHGVLRWGQ